MPRPLPKMPLRRKVLAQNTNYRVTRCEGSGGAAMRTYLVVMDETEEARQALRFASLRAQKTGGSVHILALVPQQTFNAFGGVQATIEQEARERAEVMANNAAGNNSSYRVTRGVLRGPRGARRGRKVSHNPNPRLPLPHRHPARVRGSRPRRRGSESARAAAQGSL